jgi:hypothetical protein
MKLYTSFSLTVSTTVTASLLSLAVGDRHTTTTASSRHRPHSAAFIFSDFVASVVPKSMTGHTRSVQHLDKCVDILTDSTLTIRLDVHENDSNGRVLHRTSGGGGLFEKSDPIVGMCIQSLQVALSDSTRESTTTSRTEKSKKKGIVMPGANGPYPAVSSGVNLLNVKAPGQFIDMTGLVKLPFDSTTACWELVWRENAMNGYLICALSMPIDKDFHKGNNKAASLPGNNSPIYISFPVWTRTDLEDYQKRKVDVLESAAKYLAERDEELMKMQMTSNVLQKALHYRNAAAAAEMYSLFPVHQMSTKVPDDNDVIPLDMDSSILLTKQGTIWTNAKHDKIISPYSIIDAALFGPVRNKQQLLGNAFITRRDAVVPKMQEPYEDDGMLLP